MSNEKYSQDTYDTAFVHNVQLRFAAMMVHTCCWNINRRGADMVSFISDRKSDYFSAHPEMLAPGGNIINQQHFTDFICSGIWRKQ